MKAKKLEDNFEYDFDLYGLISSVKGFKLAWSINQSLLIELVNIPDIELVLRDNRRQNVITYEHKTANLTIMLLHNRTKDLSGSDSGFFLPEMNKIDYFLRIDGDIYPSNATEVLEKLRQLPTIEYAMRIDVKKLKNKENLILY